MMSIVAVDHVQLAAPSGCEAQARWFFGDLLGLLEIEKPEALRARCRGEPSRRTWRLSGARRRVV